MKPLKVKDRAAWRAWLSKNHGSSDGIWLAVPKASSRAAGPRQHEAVEEALCFGWIDSQVRGIDRASYMQRFTPRRAGGTWSGINKRRVEKLIAAGRMTESGLRAIEDAKRDGSWERLAAVDELKVPEDLARALKGKPAARRTFDRLPPSTRKQYIWLVDSAKREETRRRRIVLTLRMLAQGRRFDADTRLDDA